MDKHFIKVKNRLLEGMAKLGEGKFCREDYILYWLASFSEYVKIFRRIFSSYSVPYIIGLKKLKEEYSYLAKKIKGIVLDVYINYEESKDFKVIFRSK
jgi:hypothetical protein